MNDHVHCSWVTYPVSTTSAMYSIGLDCDVTKAPPPSRVCVFLGNDGTFLYCPLDAHDT